MPLRVIRRKDTGRLQITGHIRLPGAEKGRRVRETPQSDDPRLAREEAAILEAKLLREAWHGKRRSSRSFAEAVDSYLHADDRSTGTINLVRRIAAAVGDVSVASVNQATLDKARRRILKKDASPATVTRNLIVPLRAILTHAARRGWCEAPTFEIPRQPEGRTLYLLPAGAERLVAAAAPHVKPLLLFLLGTGARMSEAIELQWRDVDLRGARAILWRTKAQRRRNVLLPPRLVAALASLPHREDAVFRWETLRPTKAGDRKPKRIQAYADRGREGGGQIKRAWSGAIRRAALDPALTPHDLRHTWASWHYAMHRDLLALKAEGQWSSVTLVERYAHLMPAGYEAEIRAFWHYSDTAIQVDDVSA